MIKIESAGIWGWGGAIEGMRNPMNSWGNSDSDWSNGKFRLGQNDLKLMKALIKGGGDERKFLRMIHVQMDITAPLYWWKEFDTYKVGTVANSCSTMHKIHSKEFTLDDFSTDKLVSIGAWSDSVKEMNYTIETLNFWRDRFNESEEARDKYFRFNGYDSVPSKKDCWYQMIQLLPSSYNQKRTVDLNYEVLLRMYPKRKNHKLDEWRTFCDWIMTLPYMKEFIEV